MEVRVQKGAESGAHASIGSTMLFLNNLKGEEKMSQFRIASYLSDNRERHLEELRQFLKLPSISSLSAHKDDVQRTASWVADALEQAGLKQVRIMPTGGHPVVYGEPMESKDRPTVLI
jgi:hypothetical protein